MVAHALVLGAEGMLGATVVRRLRDDPDIRVSATGRNPATDSGLLPFVAGERRLIDLLDEAGTVDYVVNCIALTKHRIHDRDPEHRRRAIRLNADLPYEIAEAAAERGAHAVQITTDCVFSGGRGPYDEGDAHDALDVYGKTKSLGEVPSEHVLNVRSSIIGLDPRRGGSLVEWFLSQPRGARVPGYVDHRWNGVTSAVFADLLAGLVTAGSTLSGTVHLVPQDAVDKATLLGLIRTRFDRADLTVVPTTTEAPIDRVLATREPEVNRWLWAIAGYPQPPTISALVAGMPG